MGEAKPIEALVAEARDGIAQEINAKAGQLDAFETSLGDLRERQKKLQEEVERHLDEFRDHRKKLEQEIERQLNHLAETSMQELRAAHQKLEEAIAQQLTNLGQYVPPVPVASLDKLLNSVQNLITATLPDQLLEALTEEAEHLGVRAAIFDVRGKAAWGLSARGFGASLSEKTFRALVVPLNQEGPFRQVFETGGHIDASPELLKKNRNVLDKLKPGKEDRILLLPIRSAGSVSAIFYTDSGGQEEPLPADALKILSEFTGAQLDRLMALSGGAPAEVDQEEKVGRRHEKEEERAEASQSETEETAERASEHVPARQAVEEPPPPTAAAAEAPPVAAESEPGQLSEEEQKRRKDAKRFAKLLISEIELYNKTKVADGRKNKDLYKRLKSDIDRSRLTFHKRFAKSDKNRVDLFHEELIHTLANDDASAMGPEYTGPSA